MQEVRTPAQEAAEDIFFGQIVLIWARWAIILAGATIVLWTANTVGQLTGNMLAVVALMAVNFYLHGRYYMELPANWVLLLAASVLDLAIITWMVFFFGRPGLQSPFFVFYTPVLVAFAFVFPPRVTILYTVVALFVYIVGSWLDAPSLVANPGELKVLAMRAIVLGSMGFLGTYYWRIQRDRRRTAAGVRAQPEIQAQPRLAITGE